MSDLMRVYLAGKIRGADGWRDVLVRSPSVPWSESFYQLEDMTGSDEDGSGWYVLGNRVPDEDGPPPWPVIPAGFLGIADYVGPYAMGWAQEDGHGSSPFNNGLLPDDFDDSRCRSDERLAVVRRCLQAIDAADVVVAVVTGDSPGLLCELGYAYALRRPIIALVRSGAPFDWFPQNLCLEVLNWFDDGPDFAEHVRHALANSAPYQNGLYAILSRLVDKQIYYHSRWWKNRRHAALLKAGGKCQFCAATADLEVHHNTYANVYREPDCDLCVLCDSCHKSADVRRRAQQKALVKASG